MPITVYWEDDTKRIIRWDFDGKWTWEDVYNASREAVNLRVGMPDPVVVYVNQSKAANIVPSGALHHLSNLIHMGRESRRLLVIISPFEFYHQLGRIILSVYREMARKIIMVRTFEEAEAVVAPYRVPLPPESKTPNPAASDLPSAAEAPPASAIKVPDTEA